MRSRHTTHIVRSAGWPAVVSVAAVVASAAWTSPSVAQQPQQPAQQPTRAQQTQPPPPQDARSEDQGGSFSVQPENLTFGRTALFFKRTDSFVVRNHGRSALRNVKAELGGYNEGVFSLDNQCGESLAPGQQCEIRVSFEPTSDGDKSAELRITAGDGAVRTRQLTGSGAAAKYSATPKSLAFGKVASGTASKEQVVTITNTGDVALPITATSLSGENERQFAQSNDCPRELAPGKSCRSTVLFRPTWQGDHEATLTVWAKGGAPETKVRLSGTGIAERDGTRSSSSSSR